MLIQQVVHWAWIARNEKVYQGLERKMKVQPRYLIRQALVAHELNLRLAYRFDALNFQKACKMQNPYLSA